LIMQDVPQNADGIKRNHCRPFGLRNSAFGFRLADVKRVFEAPDKWKRVHRRATALLRLGLDAETA